MRLAPPAAPCAALVLLLCAAAPAAAKKIYKVVDAQGITHYTDRKPEDGAAAEVIKVRAEQQDIAALRLEGFERERRAVVSNRLAGAIEVELSFTSHDNIAPDPPLPLRQVIPPESERSIATLRSLDPARPAGFALQFTAVPGDPAARHDGTVYRLPVDSGAWRIDQGYGGGFSHGDAQSRYAIDLAVDEGTPVVAAREGVVMQVEDDFEGAGLDREKYGGRANHVRVLHADGTMAIYAHLLPESVTLAPGQRVRTGQRIGASGNTGFSTGPHLHFAVQLNRGMELVSIPFALEGPAGPIPIPGEESL
jgi:murein DD-endopeptidase MepM/ murein hydrolase activator NlpD